MNKRGSNDPLWPMNRHPDQTFREDVSHSEKEIPSSYLGEPRRGRLGGHRGAVPSVENAGRAPPSAVRCQRDFAARKPQNS